MRLVALVLRGAIILAPSSAHASEGDGSEPALLGSLHPELAGRFMAAAATLTPSQSTPPLHGGGPGVRAGVSFMGVYAGLSFIDNLSESSCIESSCSSTMAASYGLELGFGHMFFRRLIVRALLGMGDHVITSDGTIRTCSGIPLCSMVTNTASHASRGDLYLAPALLVAVTLGPVLVGVDATIVYMPTAGAPNGPSASFASIQPGAQLGLRL